MRATAYDDAIAMIQRRAASASLAQVSEVLAEAAKWVASIEEVQGEKLSAPGVLATLAEGFAKSAREMHVPLEDE